MKRIARGSGRGWVRRLAARPVLEVLEGRALPSTLATVPIEVVPIVTFPAPSPPAPAVAIAGSGLPGSATAGVPTSFLPLAAFTAPLSAMADSSSRSTIAWGDGSTSPGLPTADLTIRGGDITDRVAGRHDYANPGTYTYTVTYTLDGSTGTANGTITVTNGTPVGAIQGQGIGQTATAGQSANFSPIATFTVPAPVFYDSGFQIDVAWGDGSPSGAGMVGMTSRDVGDQVALSVDAAHTYAAPGTYTFQAAYVSGGVTLATATGTVTVSSPGSTPPVVPIVLAPPTVASPLSQGPSALPAASPTSTPIVATPSLVLEDIPIGFSLPPSPGATATGSTTAAGPFKARDLLASPWVGGLDLGNGPAQVV